MTTPREQAIATFRQLYRNKADAERYEAIYGGIADGARENLKIATAALLVYLEPHEIISDFIPEEE